MPDLTTWPDDPADAALILDFDGTLAPIVSDPSSARMPSSTAAVVARLARRLGRVAIVSGRPARFLQRWAPLPGVSLVGLYGLEHIEDGEVVPHPEIAAYADTMVGARAELFDLVQAWPGSELEDKGHAVALHWRRAEDPAAGGALAEGVREVAGRRGLHAEDGKMVIELRPPVAADKGTAVVRLADGFGEVAFAGDDLGDLPAFAATGRRGGLRVAVDHGVETDQSIRAAADVVLEGTDGMLAWLTAMAERLES